MNSLPQIRNESKWQRKKLAAQWAATRLVDAAASTDDAALRASLLKRASRMSICGHSIIVAFDKDGKGHIERAALCRDRLCPICTWRLAARRSYEMQQTVKLLLEKDPHIKGIMLTLTVKNCEKSEVRQTISHLCKSFTRLKKARAWCRYIKGYARSIELTYNEQSKTYHPHIHCLLIVGEEYKAYISQPEFADMWQTAARLDYRPVVDVRYTYNKQAIDSAEAALSVDKLSAMRDGIIEATKYSFKPSALNAVLSDEELASLAAQLAGHRLIAYGGCIKAARAECGFTSDEEPNDIIPLEPVGGGELERMAFEWASNEGRWKPVSWKKIENEQDIERHLYAKWPRRGKGI